MKRIFALIAVISVFLGAMAQRPLVTLSHNGELSFYTNVSPVDALQEAIDASKDGDVIYLSEGNYGNYLYDIFEISTKVSIVGCGYNTFISEIRYQNLEGKMHAPLLDGVQVRSVGFGNNNNYGHIPSDLDNAEIINSRIQNLNIDNNWGENCLVTIDRCRIDGLSGQIDPNDGAASKDNVIVRNSKINSLNEATNFGIINCNVYFANDIPLIVQSCIISMYNNAYGKPEIRNSLLPVIRKDDARVTCIDCYFENSDFTPLLNDELESDIDLEAKNYLGTDGKVVGVYGGEVPYTENPSVPTIDAANSSVEYDANSKKLNVKINVFPN